MKRNLAREHFQNRNVHGCLFVSRKKKHCTQVLWFWNFETTILVSVYFFPRETKRHPWTFRFWKWSRVKFRFTGGFLRNDHGQKKNFTGEIFENDHGRFSRVTRDFWIWSRAGKKFHVQLFREMTASQSEGLTCVCVCVFLGGASTRLSSKQKQTKIETPQENRERLHTSGR